MTPRSEDLIIRLARVDDAAAVVDIHRSHVDRWYRQIEDEQYEVSYSDLTVEERFGFGGPWMAIETCAVHLNNLFLRRFLPVVAEADGRLVAEMELFIGREGRPYNKNCHIGVLYVHKDYLGRGIGRRLVERAILYARDAHCDTITVAATEDCEEFYRKCGFSFHDTLVEVEVEPHEFLVDLEPMPPPVNVQTFTWGMDMEIGRLQSSAFHVFEMGDDFALPSELDHRHVKTFASVNGNLSLLSYIFLPSGTAEVSGWSMGTDAADMVFAALTDLDRRGATTARMLLSKTDYDKISELIDERLLGSRHTLWMKL